MVRAKQSAAPISVRDAADIIRIELSAGDVEMALRIVTQSATDFDKASTVQDVEDFLAPPSSTGDERFDVLIATIFRWKAAERGIELPEWTDVPPLRDEWIPGSIGEPLPEYADWVRKGTPPIFLEKNVLAFPKSWRAA